MKNTKENKQKFFAQYWGQKVFKFPNTSNYETNEVTRNVFQEIYKNGYLELTPLSAISDEDAIEVARIVCAEMFMSSSGKATIDRNEKEWLTVRKKYSSISVDIDYTGFTSKYHEEDEYKMQINQAYAIDFLRSRSYALPFMGVSVDQQIEYGWIKLKTTI